MEMSTNEFEERNRQRKAMAIVAVLASAFDGAGIPVEEVEAFSDEQWGLAASVASERDGHVYGLPSEKTRELVLSSYRVRRRDMERAPDPFAGIGGR